MADIFLWIAIGTLFVLVCYGLSVLKVSLLKESTRNTGWPLWERNEQIHVIDPFFYGYPGFLMRKKIKYKVIIDRKNSQILFLCKPTKFQLFYEVFEIIYNGNITKMSDNEAIMAHKGGILQKYNGLKDRQEEYRRKSGKKNVTRFVEDVRKAESL